LDEGDCLKTPRKAARLHAPRLKKHDEYRNKIVTGKKKAALRRIRFSQPPHVLKIPVNVVFIPTILLY